MAERRVAESRVARVARVAESRVAALQFSRSLVGSLWVRGFCFVFYFERISNSC